MREIWKWHASGLDREMGVARWGHFGKPVIVFPTGGADFLDVERFKLIYALRPLIDAGRIKVYAVDSVCRQSWTSEVSPRDKVQWQVAYGAWLEDELFPLIRKDCSGTVGRFAVAGASLGAYQAWTAAARRPDAIDLCIGMSGTYAMDRRLNGHWDEDWYFHDPHQFVAGMPEGPVLHQLRSVQFVLGIGERYENPAYTDAAATLLARKAVPTSVLRWRDPAGHDWPTWRTMLPAALNHWV